MTRDEFQKRLLRIDVCGGIASGKTTFSKLLKKININPILEDFNKNPFWEPFYVDPILHAFETEITFLLQHYHQIKIVSKSNETFVCDFSLLLDLAYADVTLSGGKQDAFVSVYKQVTHELPLPSLLVYLRCGASTELERIKRRGREVEKAITIDYLAAVNNALEHRVKELDGKVSVLEISSEHKDFVSNSSVQQELIQQVQQAIISKE